MPPRPRRFDSSFRPSTAWAWSVLPPTSAPTTFPTKARASGQSAETTVQWLSAPTSGIYGTPVALRARLSQGASPLAGRVVAFETEGGCKPPHWPDADGAHARRRRRPSPQAGVP